MNPLLLELVWLTTAGFVAWAAWLKTRSRPQAKNVWLLFGLAQLQWLALAANVEVLAFVAGLAMAALAGMLLATKQQEAGS